MTHSDKEANKINFLAQTTSLIGNLSTTHILVKTRIWDRVVTPEALSLQAKRSIAHFEELARAHTLENFDQKSIEDIDPLQQLAFLRDILHSVSSEINTVLEGHVCEKEGHLWTQGIDTSDHRNNRTFCRRCGLTKLKD